MINIIKKLFCDSPYDFCTKMLKILIVNATNDDNIAISPSRLQSLLVILANWSNPDLRQKILKAMDIESQDINDANKLCDKQMFSITPWESEDEIPKIELNTFFWLMNGLNINKEALKKVSSMSDIMLKIVDFTKPETKSIIDKAIKHASHGLIKGINDDIPKDTLALITDILYFKAKWQEPFDEEDTKEQLFYGTRGKVKVPMMHQHDIMDYHETSKFQMVRLKYVCWSKEDKCFSMRIILPKKGIDIANAIQDMNKMDFYKCFEEEDVKLSLPKFTIESDINMKELLSNLGLKCIYESNDIMPECVKNLKITDIVQQVKVKVNENDTEAAALTYLREIGCCLPIEKPKTIVMKVNRPFIFEIVEDSSNTVLFAGVINNI